MQYVNRCVVAALFVCGVAPSAPAQTTDAARVRAEAVEALQGGVPDPFLREGDIALAADAIAAVRRRYPDVRGIGPSSRTPLVLALTDSAWTRLLRLHPEPAGDTLIARTGLPGIDSMNAALGARGVRLDRRPFSGEIVPVFAGVPNVPVLADRYQPLAEVAYAGPPLLIGGGGSSIQVRIRGDTVDLHLGRGWGDCPAGCIYHRSYGYRYDRRTRRAVQVSDSGDPTPRAGLEEWLRGGADWADFDGRSREVRGAYAAALAANSRTSLRILRGLAPRMQALGFGEAGRLLERADVRRDRMLVAHLASLPGDDGREARQVLFDEHGLALARDRRVPAFALRALLDEFTRRDPPPRQVSQLLLRNPVVTGDRELLLHVLREVHPLTDLLREGCRTFVARGHPVWERMQTPDGSPGGWYSRVPCPDLGAPPPP